MFIDLDRDSTVPLTTQVADGIVAAIGRGELKAGNRLPAARELAWALHVNLHTVLASYGRLRDLGILDVRRYRGTTVRDGLTADVLRIEAELRALVREAATYGLTTDRVAAIVREEGLWDRSTAVRAPQPQ